MKAKILLLIIFSGLLMGCCRSKQKITTVSKESKQETEKVKVDSLSLQRVESAQSSYAGVSFNEKKNEISGDLLIKGKSDLSTPFVFHNVVGTDTIQSISIMGNAEYSINNHYAKTSNKKTENKKEEVTNIFQDAAQHAVSKELIKEKTSVVSEETKKVKITGFEIAVWVFVTILGITLILLFFIYKYFKK
ncbi:hypothetical protein ASG22_16110 [Chryseobacterium sp. Leaf405]|uniref:hypothetical protein n=1 Tax=Chryseobacterium sp. Leaf405 TaxID=1736367 RepID=UPI0007007740|nr:hypothetical protein [Chryseobacterium sp. Leaf405]KQT20942.1 hypothetical protein ASG22_16110 [Chryseobacterium sp. Leaf405]